MLIFMAKIYLKAKHVKYKYITCEIYTIHGIKYLVASKVSNSRPAMLGVARMGVDLGISNHDLKTHTHTHTHTKTKIETNTTFLKKRGRGNGHLPLIYKLCNKMSLSFKLDFNKI